MNVHTINERLLQSTIVGLCSNSSLSSLDLNHLNHLAGGTYLSSQIDEIVIYARDTTALSKVYSFRLFGRMKIGDIDRSRRMIDFSIVLILRRSTDVVLKLSVLLLRFIIIPTLFLSLRIHSYHIYVDSRLFLDLVASFEYTSSVRTNDLLHCLCCALVVMKKTYKSVDQPMDCTSFTYLYVMFFIEQVRTVF